MQFQGKSFALTLENNAAARDFYALLPLRLSCECHCSCKLC
ncbi:cyclophilin-like fold protein [Helicobacter typhlonius]